MKCIYLFILASMAAFPLLAQELVEVEGAVTIGKMLGNSPNPGTIHWDGSDFLGYDGFRWKSLTQMVTYDGTVEDYEGNIYPTVIIGDQEWMARNLKTGKYKNGVQIDELIGIGWSSNTTGAFCWLGDRYVYGYLYNWYAVTNSNGLCPDGWKVPNDSDWDNLYSHLEENGYNDVGGKLKEKRTAHWLGPNREATNEVGFTALPAGQRTDVGAYQQLNEYSGFWSRTSVTTTTASRKYMKYDSGEIIGAFAVDKNTGFSVRCMRDVN